MSTNASATYTATAPWTLRSLIVSHKRASAVIAALCVLTVAALGLTFLGASAGPVTDSTTCSAWGSTDVNRQAAYARLYVREHGDVSPRWGPAPGGVINAINAGCYQAYGEGVADQATLIQAIARSF